MNCSRPEVAAKCRRLSCLHPRVCRLLDTDTGPLIELMRETRSLAGVQRVLVASGVRMDLAVLSPQYLKELATHHVGGHLKVAPEHVHAETLRLMNRPPCSNFEEFTDKFNKALAGVRKGAVPGTLFHLGPPRHRSGRDDRVGGLLEEDRLPSTTGAGFHPGTARPGNLHVSHGFRSDDDESPSMWRRACASAECTGR